MGANQEIIAELRRVLNERDEAREQLDLTKRELGRWVDRETKAVRERDEWRDKFLALNQTAGELCNACGWAFRIPGESCRCEVVKERDEARAELATLRKDYDSVLEANVGLLDGAPYVDARAAFRRGAEAMREACARWIERECANERTAWHVARLPIPEEP